MSGLPELSALRQILTDASEKVGLSSFGLRETKAKVDGSVVTELDHEMQRLISTELKTCWPEFSFMGEEMDHDEQARIVLEGQDQGFWALDPLDGTTNFAMGFPFYGVSLALVKNGEPTLGVVYDPVRRECFSASAGGGAYLDGVPLKTLRRHSRCANVWPTLTTSVSFPDWQTRSSGILRTGPSGIWGLPCWSGAGSLREECSFICTEAKECGTMQREALS